VVKIGDGFVGNFIRFLTVKELPRSVKLTFDKVSAKIKVTPFDGSRGIAYLYRVHVGPLSRTVPQFWQMIWQENVLCIVMATSLFQHAKVWRKR